MSAAVFACIQGCVRTLDLRIRPLSCFSIQERTKGADVPVNNNPVHNLVRGCAGAEMAGGCSK
jgi:hypothetical protein